MCLEKRGVPTVGSATAPQPAGHGLVVLQLGRSGGWPGSPGAKSGCQQGCCLLEVPEEDPVPALPAAGGLLRPVSHVPASPCPHVPMSPCPHVPVSPHTHILISPCPHIPMSPCPHIPMSPHSHVHLHVHLQSSNHSPSSLPTLLLRPHPSRDLCGVHALRLSKIPLSILRPTSSLPFILITFLCYPSPPGSEAWSIDRFQRVRTRTSSRGRYSSHSNVLLHVTSQEEFWALCWLFPSSFTGSLSLP